MNRDLFGAACRRKRNFTEMSNDSVPSTVQNCDTNNPLKKFNIIGIKDDCESHSKNPNENLSKRLSLESKEILANIAKNAFDNTKGPKGSIFPSSSTENPFTQINPFKKQGENSSNGKNSPQNPFLTINPFSSSNNISINTNINITTNKAIDLIPKVEIPNLDAPTNFNDNKLKKNPFLSSENNPFLKNFNFNLNAVPINKVFIEEDEEEEKGGVDNFNPEEEVPINASGKGTSVFKQKEAKENEVKEQQKYYNKFIEDFSVYNSKEKKFQSKGNGMLSIEAFKSEKTEKINYILLFRNVNTKKTLFHGNIIKGQSYIERKEKVGMFIVFIYKIFSQVNTTIINNSVRVKFFDDEMRSQFIDKFGECTKKEENDTNKQENELKECNNLMKEEVKEEKDEGKEKEKEVSRPVVLQRLSFMKRREKEY